MSVLSLNHVFYQYANVSQYALEDISVEFNKGKIYAIVGASGAGKSTLLSLIAGLDVATSGTISYKGNDLKEIDRDDYRGKEIGVVFQNYNLLRNANAMENMLLSMNISGVNKSNMVETAEKLLEKVGITKEDRKRKILQLSGGEQQRVSIARALSHDPEVIIADEPTGNLDSDNTQKIIEILKRLAYEENRCIIIVTHSGEVADFADVVYTISKGQLLSEK